MPQVSVLIAQFPGCNSTKPVPCEYATDLFWKAKADPRFSKVGRVSVSTTPITMGRNRVAKAAAAQGFDYVVMIDSDMVPDHQAAKPFWESSWEFIFEKHLSTPCIIGAPYCGPPPHENIYVFQLANRQSGHPNADWRIEQFTREEAFARAGIEKVLALPTGIIIIDVRAFKLLPPPWFEYEFKDAERSEMASTEDVFFTRNASLIGIPNYCNWDSWAGHIKEKVVSKPQPLTIEVLAEDLRKTVAAGISSREKLMFIGTGPDSPIAEAPPRPVGYTSDPALEARHRELNKNTPADSITIREGLTFKIHQDSRFPFEHFCYRSPTMVAELDRFIEMTKGRKCLLDVGAADGLFSLVFSDLSGLALPVDASLIAAERLRHNILRNNKLMSLSRCAMSDSCGEIEMRYEHTHAVAAGGYGEPFNVPKLTGDRLCDDLNFSPDTIKIDVEGHEVKVVRGLAGTIRKHKPLVFCELHPKRILEEGDDINELLTFFDSLGYSTIEDPLPTNELHVVFVPPKPLTDEELLARCDEVPSGNAHVGAV